MEEKEFRIGNYIHATHEIEIDRGNGIIEDVETVLLLRIRGIDEDGQLIDGSCKFSLEEIETDYQLEKYMDLQPIPITEQWLLDFGFEKVETEIGPPINDVWDSFEKEEVKLTKYVDFKNKGWMLENVCSIFTPDLKYIHQLQNLYYSLTGEELIKK